MVRRPSRAREQALRRRAVPLAAAAALAFAGGLYMGRMGGGDDRRAAEAYARAWAAGDVLGMRRLLDPDGRMPRAVELAERRLAAWRTATAESARVTGRAHRRDGVWEVPVAVRTRVFGIVRAPLRVDVSGGRVRWAAQSDFPGLREGERLSRTTRLPPRAAILARDGTVLARGPRRTTPVPSIAGAIVGQLGAPAPADRDRYTAAGYPPGAAVGISGLERVFQRDLAGTPGGVLRAGARTLARSDPRPGSDVRSSIDLAVERAAIAALAGRYGGAAAVDPRTGEVLALAGVAFSALQPPGSTFKIVTAAAALKAHLVRPGSVFPIRTEALLEGRPLQNANGEACGGTFEHSFAESCNSVFAPLGARVGARRLVAMAEAFGFNRPLPIPGAATSTIPPPSQMTGDLDVGSSAIGQGRVQASALQMTLVAATIAGEGRRPVPTLRAGGRPRLVAAVPAHVARLVRRLMVGVVRSGTGTAAAIPGVVVAGKTGTAELRDTTKPAGEQPGAAPAPETDAWFVAFAPALNPRIAAGMLLVQAGAGGAVAAPAVREILVAGLRRH